MADLTGDITCIASSSSSSTNTGQVFDVFLNHRGPDTKKGLASHIYRGLIVRGLRVFLDQPELRKGEDIRSQIEEAIRTASVHVAIFSPTYAQSRWCLNELALMVESGSTIIPVFHNVNPSELRWTRSGDGDEVQSQYARDLQRLEKKRTSEGKPRYDSSTLKKWRDALHLVSNKSGFDMNAYDGDEGRLVYEVVKEVWRKVSKASLHVAEYATGLKEKIEYVERMVQQQSQKRKVVGIVGLGGLGKTTLAKKFFNRHRKYYDRSCFLFDVRENAAKSSLSSLQTQLLKDLAHLPDEQIRNIDEGKEKLRKHISSCPPSLLVLDDVDHIDQLGALFSPFKDTIHSSSLILVTSRDREVLKRAGIVEASIYQQPCLNRRQSRALFWSHAFDPSSPVTGFEQLVEDFLDFCDGLPLSLKVIGANIRGKDSKIWKRQLDKNKRILPTDIHSKLKTSYDGLDREEQEIFLDVACFLIGENRDTAITIWSGSGWDGSLGLLTLQNRCLVEIDSEECIRMHDHLRDLGRDVAEEKHPLRLSRLNVNLLRTLSPSSPVRGIRMNYGNGREQFFENVTGNCNLSRLELLSGEGSFVESVFSAAELRQLIYLRWENCPISSISLQIPTLSKALNLRVLYIEGKALKTLWQHESEAPLQLTELYIDAPLSEVPQSIGKLNQLERIVLKNGYFKTLPNEFYDMHSLKHITLQNCKQMMLLPDSVGILTGLQTLDLSGCASLERLPDWTGQLTGLQSLHLVNCTSLQGLPVSTGQLTGLQSLHLVNCTSLQGLPDSVGQLTGLRALYLRGCSSLQGLQELDLNRCSSMQGLPDSVGQLTGLQELYLNRCSSLQGLPDSVGQLTGLRVFCLSGCSSLQWLPDSVGQLTGLRALYLRGCSSLQGLPDSVGQLMGVRTLYLRGCSSLQGLPESVGQLTGLKGLDLRRCSSLQGLPESVGQLTGLERLLLGWCSSLQRLPDSVGQLTGLEILDLGGWSSLQGLPDSVAQLTGLHTLDLSGCSSLQGLPDSVGQLTDLLGLHLDGCSSLQGLPDSVGNLTRLKWVDLSGCSNLQMLPNFRHLSSLKELRLSGCSNLQMPPNVQHLSSLVNLYVSDCSKLQWGAGVVESLRHRLGNGFIEEGGENSNEERWEEGSENSNEESWEDSENSDEESWEEGSENSDE